ncbi:hypothetical protein [Prosthecobacter sp.]
MFLLVLACSALAQDSLMDEIRTASLSGKTMRCEELSSLAYRIFEEADLVFKEKAVAQRWILRLNDDEVVKALRRLCETCTRQVKISSTLETAELLESSRSIQVQVAVAELVTRALRQNPQVFDEATVEDKLQLVLPSLKKLVKQGVELQALLGTDSRPMLFNTSPPPSHAEVAANNAKSLLPKINKAQERLLDAVWQVYVKRLKLSREEAIARLVRSGMTEECVKLLLKAAYDE